jgi:hypothetical protein
MAGTYLQNSYSIQEGLVRILKMDEAPVRVGTARRCGEDNPPRVLNPKQNLGYCRPIPLTSKILVDDKQRTAHKLGVEIIKVFSPTDAQLDSLKNNFKFALKTPTCFGVKHHHQLLK